MSATYLLVADGPMETKVPAASVLANTSFLLVLMTASSWTGMFGTEASSMSRVQLLMATSEVKRFGGRTSAFEGLQHFCFVDFLMETLDDEHLQDADVEDKIEVRISSTARNYFEVPVDTFEVPVEKISTSGLADYGLVVGVLVVDVVVVVVLVVDVLAVVVVVVVELVDV